MDDFQTEPVDSEVTQFQDDLTEQTQHVNMITDSVCGEEGMGESFQPDTTKSEQIPLAPSSAEESLLGEEDEGSKAGSKRIKKKGSKVDLPRVVKGAKIRKDEEWERMLDGNYKCKYCSYANKKARLKEHIRIHTGEKPHCCHLCSFSSAYERNISRHHQRCHKLLPKTGGEHSLPSKRKGKVKLIVKFPPPKMRVPKSDDLIDLSSDLHHPLNNDEDMDQTSLDSSLSTNANGVSSHGPPAHMSTSTCPDGVSEDEKPPIVTQHQDLGSPLAVGVQTPPAEDCCYPEDRKYSPSGAGLLHSGTPAQDQPQKCLHCDVDFGDNILYTIHMGCHGYEHAFQCNICGYTCRDKYHFACHFARGQHVK